MHTDVCKAVLASAFLPELLLKMEQVFFVADSAQVYLKDSFMYEQLKFLFKVFNSYVPKKSCTELPFVLLDSCIN